jgi:predicted amidohydrolase YtcJ
MGTLWFGGTIYTLQYEGHHVEAVLTEEQKIIDVGTVEELERKYPTIITEKRDLKGNTMIPGFVDSHLHLIGHGEKLIRLDLSQMTSKHEALDAVEKYASTFPKGEWIIGEGWNENLWDEPVPITRKELDQVVKDHPVLLKRVCRHAIVANTYALELAGITNEVVSPPGGVIETYEDGSLSGLLKDQAQELLLSVVPGVSAEYLKTALRAAIQNAYELGLTGAHSEDLNYYGGFEQTYNTFKEVIEGEGYKFRAHLLVHHGVSKDFTKSGGAYQSGSEWIEFGAIKIFADGALGGRTALLSHPYNDDPSTNGVAIFTQKQLDDLIQNARTIGMPVAIHTIGDLAFEMALTSIEDHPLNGPGRDRLIHAQILRKELIDRAKKLPLILDIQPRFLAADFPWVIDRVGEENMTYCYAWRTLLNEGIPCAGGSDAPIEPLDPLLGIHAAVTRSNLDDPDQIIYKPEEALSIYEATSLFTKGSAYAICHEHDRGLIQPGFLADFTILDQDIFQIKEELIPQIKVNQTVIGGTTVFEREILNQ